MTSPPRSRPAARVPTKRAKSQSSEPDVCFACREPKELLMFPCGHGCCHEDIRPFIEPTLDSEATFPPTCCGQLIDISSLAPFVPADFMALMQAKLLEYSVQMVDRVHCYNCRTFIATRDDLGERASQKRAHCAVCKMDTCQECKKQHHRGPCKDESDQTVFDLAEKKGWKQCPGCKAIVERRTGCEHIQ